MWAPPSCASLHEPPRAQSDHELLEALWTYSAVAASNLTSSYGMDQHSHRVQAVRVRTTSFAPSATLSSTVRVAMHAPAAVRCNVNHRPPQMHHNSVAFLMRENFREIRVKQAAISPHEASRDAGDTEYHRRLTACAQHPMPHRTCAILRRIFF